MQDLSADRVVVVGTDGSRLAEPTVARAANLAWIDDADLVIVCAYSGLSRREEARNVASLGGDGRAGEVLGRTAAGQAISQAAATASHHGATVAAALIDAGRERRLGTVATEVIERAPCDILVVRPAEPGEIPVPESDRREVRPMRVAPASRWRR